MDVRKFPAEAERVETGAVQFGDDWPGVFIRGDNAFAFALSLDAILGEGEPEAAWLYRAQLAGLSELLRSCQVRAHLANDGEG